MQIQLQLIIIAAAAAVGQQQLVSRTQGWEYRLQLGAVVDDLAPVVPGDARKSSAD
jgi:hypothetical protein